MYTIVNKNTFFPNVPNEHENTFRQGKNGKLRKARRYQRWGKWPCGRHSCFTFAVYVKFKLSIALFLHVTRIRNIRKIFELPRFETVRFGRNTIKYTAISRKVVRKTVQMTIPKGNMGYDEYTVRETIVVEPTFDAFI